MEGDDRTPTLVREFSFAWKPDLSVPVDVEPGIHGGMVSPNREKRPQGNDDASGKAPNFLQNRDAESKKAVRRSGVLSDVLQGDTKDVWKWGFPSVMRSPRTKQQGGVTGASREPRLCHFSFPMIALLLAVQVLIVMVTVSLYVSGPASLFGGPNSRRSLMGFFRGALGDEDVARGGALSYRPPVCRNRPSFETPRRRRQMEEKESPDVSEETANSTDTGLSKLPLLIFTAGVEGCGHHYVEQVLRNVEGVKMTFTQFEPNLHLMSEETQGETGMGLGGSNCVKLPYSRLWSSFIKEIAIRLGPIGDGIYVRARDSFPMGRVRTPLARPDLINLSKMDGIIYDLKVLLVVRNLTSTFTSAFRRGYHDGDLGLMARIMEDEMVYLDASIRSLPCGSYMVLDFDVLVEKPEAVVGPMAEFLDIGADKAGLLRAFKLATEKKPSHNTEPPQVAGNSIEEFFGERAMMWPLLHACTTKPLFYPTHAFDWPAS